MRKTLCLLLCLAVLPLFTGCQGEKWIKYTAADYTCFDTVTSFAAYAPDKASFDRLWEEVRQQLNRYHRLFTAYDRYEGVTNVAALNDLAGQGPVAVEPALMDLLVFSREAAAFTGGKTDVSLGAVLSLWHRYRQEGLENPAAAQLPPMEELKSAAAHTGRDKLVLDKEQGTVCYTDPAFSLDVGAVAKGYAVEKIAQKLQEEGHTGFLLNVGGNVRTVGRRGDGRAWTVGIENPRETPGEPFAATVELTDLALVTSGSYQRYYTVEGRRYHHLIDPATLMPGENCLSVSVICADSGRGDALSTALFLLTPEEGLRLVESLEETEALWVLPDGSRQMSSGFGAYMLS